MYKTYVNWSSGKDSALSLYKLQQNAEFKISKLVTTVNKDFNRVSMHGLHVDLLEQQAMSLGLPLQIISFPAQVSMEDYSRVMLNEITQLKNEWYTHGVFGDIFLEDLRVYRDKQLETVGIEGIYPLWKKDTKNLIQEFIDLGFKAITVCVNANYLDKEFCGREVNQSFLEDLPNTVDPCGENGEFHTFVYDGPNFKQPVSFKIGEKVLRNYSKSDTDEDDCFVAKEDQKSWDTSFWFCDLLSEK